MIRYKHTQVGWVMTFTLLLGGVVPLIMAIANTNYYEYKNSLLAFSFVMLLLVLLFNSLTVEVTDEYIKIYFGRGIIHKKILIENIREYRSVKNTLVLGWGIRFGLGFTLWNVSGRDAVEFSFKNKEWKFRVGTDKPDELIAVLQKKQEA